MSKRTNNKVQVQIRQIGRRGVFTLTLKEGGASEDKNGKVRGMNISFFRRAGFLRLGSLDKGLSRGFNKGFNPLFH